jgi:hypothetical protein
LQILGSDLRLAALNEWPKVLASLAPLREISRKAATWQRVVYA